MPWLRSESSLQRGIDTFCLSALVQKRFQWDGPRFMGKERCYLKIFWELLMEVSFQLPSRGASPEHRSMTPFGDSEGPKTYKKCSTAQGLLSRHCKKVQSSPTPMFLSLSLAHHLLINSCVQIEHPQEVQVKFPRGKDLNFPWEKSATRVKMDQNGFSSEIT